MPRYFWLVGIAILAGACSTSVNVDQERTALMQRDREWSQATKNADTFMSFLTADASVYAPGGPVRSGTDAIRKQFTEEMSMPGFSIEWIPAKATVASSGDIGYTAGAYTASMGGSTEKGKYVTLWKKVEGQWKVAEDIFNADGPPPAPAHAMIDPNTLTWGPGPPSLPAGARAAVVSGDPSKAGAFILRVQVPSGYRVPPHWHPTTENLTILSGTVALAMGDTWDRAAMKDVPTGGVAVLPADMKHMFLAKTAATFQVHGQGPFAITYVNAADDPRQATK